MKSIRAACDHAAHHVKDIIACMVILTWCLSIFLPETLIDEVTQRSFERIVMVVLGFYFGSHNKENNKNKELSKCPYID